MKCKCENDYFFYQFIGLSYVIDYNGNGIYLEYNHDYDRYYTMMIMDVLLNFQMFDFKSIKYYVKLLKDPEIIWLCDISWWKKNQSNH